MKSLSRSSITRRTLVILGVLAVISPINFLWTDFALIWFGFLSLMMFLVVVDWAMVRRSRAVYHHQTWNHQPTVHEPFTLTLDITVRTSPGVKAHLEPVNTDQLQALSTTISLPATEANGHTLAEVTLTASRRGELAWPGVYLYSRSVLGLTERWQQLGEASLTIYPGMNRSLQNQFNPRLLMEQLGLKVNRMQRADQEFESMRPYVPGDNYRHIDWKASARMQSLITRQFQVEHHHNILICLDSSRLMGTRTEGVTKLDWAIEAVLQLAYLATRFDDKVGLMVFSNTVDRWVKPISHPVEAFLRSVYDVEPKIVEADYYKVCMNILTQQKKRSLVIFLSDFLDAGALEPYLGAFAQLKARHCSLFIGIEDPAYQAHLLTTDLDTADAMTRHLVALDSMQRRLGVLEQLRQMGLHALTVTPRNLVPEAMKAYLEIKLKGAI